MRNDKQEQAIRSSAAEYLTFVAATGDSTESMEMRYEDENIWLTQKMMSALYDVDVRTINEHIQKIYEDGELTDEATIRNFRIVQTEGSRQVSRQVKHYNLQMIIAVGFKVNNDRAVQFRKWANTIVKDYTIQGWAMDSDRLKNGGSVLTREYFDHLLEQIREIRMSERKFYQMCVGTFSRHFTALFGPFLCLGSSFLKLFCPACFKKPFRLLGFVWDWILCIKRCSVQFEGQWQSKLPQRSGAGIAPHKQRIKPFPPVA